MLAAIVQIRDPAGPPLSYRSLPLGDANPCAFARDVQTQLFRFPVTPL